MNWVLEWIDWFWPDWFILAWGWLATTLGTIMFLIAMANLKGRFVQGRPMTDAKTGQAMTPRQSLLWALPFGGAGLFFAVLGVLTLSWKSG